MGKCSHVNWFVVSIAFDVMDLRFTYRVAANTWIEQSWRDDME